MKPELLKIFVFVIILAFYASFFLVKIQLTMMDNDAGLYISDGKLIWQTQQVFRNNAYSYVVSDYPIYDNHWLSSVVFYLVSEYAGFSGLTIFKALILLSAFAMLFFASLKKADFWLVAACSLPTIMMLAWRVRIRPEMFSYLFIALFLYLLLDFEKHPERKRIFWLIPLQFLWVNFHIYFFIGIAFVVGFLLEKVLLNIPLRFWAINFINIISDPMVKKLLIIFPMLVAVTLINPNGVDGALSFLRSHSYANFTVSENQPFFNLKASIFSWDVFNSAFVPMVAIFLLSLVFGFRKKPFFFLAAGIGSAAVGLIHLRLITLFALMFLPAVSSNFTGTFLYIKGRLKRKWPRTAIAAGYAMTVLIILVFPYQAFRLNAYGAERGYVTDWGIGLDLYSNASGKFFREQKLQGPIFNDYDIGGYIIYHLFPEEMVFVDNNGTEAYPESFFEQILIPAFSDDIIWAENVEKYDINAIFLSIRDGSPMVGNFLWRRLRDPSWALVYADTYAVILVRNIPKNLDIIQKFHITPENVGGKIGYLLESSDVSDRIIAGRIMYLVGREDLAISSLKKVVSEYPKNSWVWLYMGSIKSLKNDPAELISSIIFLENAVDMGERSSEVYTWLGLAYFKSAQFKKAETAFQKALWLDPGRPDITYYLADLQQYL